MIPVEMDDFPLVENSASLVVKLENGCKHFFALQ
jgi:hypothetical protein